MRFNHNKHINDLPAEIFTLIFEYLEARDLTSCALICSHWSEKALYVKWSTCKVPLKALVSLYVPLKVDGSTHHWTVDSLEPVIANIISGGGAALVRRAKLVRHVEVDRSLSEELRNTLREHLTSLGISCLCPQLEEVDLVPQHSVEATCNILYGGSEELFCINLHDDVKLSSYAMSNSLDGLQSSFPYVEVINIVSHRPFTTTNLGYFSYLTVLHIEGYFDLRGWRCIARDCPELEEIEVTNVFNRAYWSGLVEDVVELNALTSLLIDNTRCIPLASGILSCSTMPALESAEISVSQFNEFRAGGSTQALNALAEGSPGLTDLTVIADAYDPLPWEILARFQRLKCLEIKNIGGENAITDDGIALLTRNMPQLENFLLETWDHEATAGPTLQSLLSFAKHCPLIQRLDLPLDCSSFHPAEAPTIEAILGALATFESALRIREEHFTDIAQYLVGLAPNAKQWDFTTFLCDSKGDLLPGMEQEPKEKDLTFWERRNKCRLRFRSLVEAYQEKSESPDERARDIYSGAVEKLLPSLLAWSRRE